MLQLSLHQGASVFIITPPTAHVAYQASSHLRIFVIQGSLIGIIGTGLGVIGGILLAQNIGLVVPFLESLFGFSLFPSDIYYITELPSDLRASDVTKFALMSLAMSLLSTLYPSWRASRTHPAEALSYD